MATGHQSPQATLPPLKYKTINTTTWGATGTSTTITDAYIVDTNSAFIAWVTGATPQAGYWSYAVTAGQVVITSSTSESAALPVSYIVI